MHVLPIPPSPITTAFFLGCAMGLVHLSDETQKAGSNACRNSIKFHRRRTRMRLTKWAGLEVYSSDVSDIFCKMSSAELYKNQEHVKGAVKVSVPSGFTDLSTIHQPLGCLCKEEVSSK